MSDVPLPEPFGAVLVNRNTDQAVMFYSPDMFPDMNTVKDRFELLKVLIEDQVHAHAAAVSAQDNARLREQLALAESVRAAQVAGLTEGAEKLREALREVIESPSVWDHYSIARAALKGASHE
jgi:hypothetical protein